MPYIFFLFVSASFMSGFFFNFRCVYSFFLEKRKRFWKGNIEVVKCLALGLPNTACKILRKSDAKIYLKDILVSHMDQEMQSFCSMSSPSILRECTGQDDDRTLFSLQKFEEEICAKATLPNDILESLCLSSRQKQKNLTVAHQRHKLIKLCALN